MVGTQDFVDLCNRLQSEGTLFDPSAYEDAKLLAAQCRKKKKDWAPWYLLADFIEEKSQGDLMSKGIRWCLNHYRKPMYMCDSRFKGKYMWNITDECRSVASDWKHIIGPELVSGPFAFCANHQHIANWDNCIRFVGYFGI